MSSVIPDTYGCLNSFLIVRRQSYTHAHKHTHLSRIVCLYGTEGQMLYGSPWKHSRVLCIATTGNRYKFWVEYGMNVFPSDLWAVKFTKWPISYKHINFFLLSLNLEVMSPTVWANGVILGGTPPRDYISGLNNISVKAVFHFGNLLQHIRT